MINVIYFVLIALGGCVLASLAAFFFVLAVKTSRVNPAEYERLRELTGSYRDALNGTVGGLSGVASTAELENDDRLQAGIAFDRRRKVLVAQAAISDDTISAVFK
ncbi:hypothetical protein [Alcanivorax quisquiliarum]|uniref:Uncharacterized protein n=1 Tax=Alcanivorax quisquiliarum TaxID=2933565 RepID=A0ABT0E2S1_9GAMM|nr:hypothetical protein [Alcanivorax quisquiliarum]MCK0536111.1 hypothetical protein [Alcanivorax quisquiliarum]